MPELPEVEYARRRLERWLDGRRVTGAWGHPAVVHGGEGALEATLAGRTFVAAERRGKLLFLRFTDDAGLFSHLGMTGRWARRPAEAPEPRWVRGRLVLDDDAAVELIDPRRFARLRPGPASALAASPQWTSLGPDPWTDRFTPADLAAALAGSRRPVKEALMEQQRIAGLGNIQVAEALFLARIDPRIRVGALDRPALRRLHRAIGRTLRETLADIEAEGAPGYLSDGAHVDNPFRVYGRAGEPCPRCSAPIVRIVQGGRGTWLCPACQGG